jgi:hypothetical protein
MNIRKFVSGSSIILMGWLGATFLNEVPAQRYPKLDKSASAPADNAADAALIAVNGRETGDFQTSASR